MGRYKCNEDVERGMFTCNADSDDTPDLHFGKGSKEIIGDQLFWEFLTSIAEVTPLPARSNAFRNAGLALEV